MQTLDFCWLFDIMKGIENIWEEGKSDNKEDISRIYCGCDRSQYDNWLWSWHKNRDSGRHGSRKNDS